LFSGSTLVLFSTAGGSSIGSFSFIVFVIEFVSSFEKGTYLIIPETIKKIKKIVGESKLQELTTINPQKILKNEEWE